MKEVNSGTIALKGTKIKARNAIGNDFTWQNYTHTTTLVVNLIVTHNDLG